MVRLPIDDARYVKPPASSIVEATLSLVQDKVREAYRASGLSWDDFALHAADDLVDAKAMEEVEAALLACGHRFDWSAAVSVAERPDAYKPAAGTAEGDTGFAHPDAPRGEADDRGYLLRGAGDNVVRHAQDVVGTARYIRTNDRVLDLLTNGVPPGTIAVIDDSGGTLTAPIIEQFAAIICAGGTVRSHLGILSREYNIPCLMNAKVSGIRDGDTVAIEASAEAKTTEDYQQGVERTGRVWLVEAAA